MKVLALAMLSAIMFAASANAQVVNHLKCYKIKDPLKLAGTADLNTPQFGVDAGCTVSKAKLFCVPGSATNVAVTDKATGLPITPQPISGPDPGDRICYNVKCPGAVADQQVTDQLGTRTVSKFKAAFICTPAVKGGPPTTFTCGSGEPIPAEWVCDGFPDCMDGSDEVGCGSTTTTPSTTTTTTTIGVFQCGSGEPIPAEWVCDGFPDCVDGSDEVGCGTTTTTPSSTTTTTTIGVFQCGSGEPIPAEWVCDGFPDCMDGSDEVGCEPPGFPSTGQTTCWNSSGAVIPCAGTGHDGDIQAGATLRYKDNGDGTITDKNTGLMWEKLSDDGSIHDKDATYTWEDAFAVKMAALNSGSFAGYTDWRAPNYKELVSIVNLENRLPASSPAFNNNCTGGCTVTTCSCTVSAGYWSSSTFAGFTTWAWFVDFFEGDGKTSGKWNNGYVRAVRGGS